MAALVQPCGCTFDSDLVDSIHHDEGQTHTLKGAPAPAAVASEPEAKPEEKAEADDKMSLLEKVDKVLSRAKKGKDTD